MSVNYGAVTTILIVVVFVIVIVVGAEVMVLIWVRQIFLYAVKGRLIIAIDERKYCTVDRSSGVLILESIQK